MFLPMKRNNNKPVRDIKKNETTNSPIQSAIKRPENLINKTLFNGLLFIMYYLKRHFQPCLFILKALKDILQHFKFVNW